MKPRVFIGSSAESLALAYAIQQNLEFDSNPTVWTQGIFELSKSALESLVEALGRFDFGVFVFSPDDIVLLRNKSTKKTRDNVVFELGLFIGKLGRERVFFVKPRNAEDFTLPTDLAGIEPGTYDNLRDDGNSVAALGPFCSQLIVRLKIFSKAALIDFAEESDEIKAIAIDKTSGWEFRLASELLKSRLNPIMAQYLE